MSREGARRGEGTVCWPGRRGGQSSINSKHWEKRCGDIFDEGDAIPTRARTAKRGNDDPSATREKEALMIAAMQLGKGASILALSRGEGKPTHPWWAGEKTA